MARVAPASRQKANPGRALQERRLAGRREATVNLNGVRCRDYVCEHGVSQSTCKCVGVKEVVPISCATTCPGRTKVKVKRRGK